MEDPEEKTSFVDSEPITLTIFTIPFRLQKDTLKIHEMPRLCAIVICLCGLCGTVTLFMREGVYFKGVNLRWISVLAMLVTSVQYSVVYLNLAMNGWGAPKSRFWCDVKIMFVRGFNTIRTMSRFFSMTLLFALLTFILGAPPSGIFYVSLLAVIAEWQIGIVENQNQYDQTIHEKFIDEQGELCLESLHTYQVKHPNESVVWSPFVISCLVKTWVITCLFLTSNLPQQWIFATPLIICILLWSYILPSVLDFMYLKNVCTFCQLELYRMVSDIIFLSLIMMFSLV